MTACRRKEPRVLTSSTNLPTNASAEDMSPTAKPREKGEIEKQRTLEDMDADMRAISLERYERRFESRSGKRKELKF